MKTLKMTVVDAVWKGIERHAEDVGVSVEQAASTLIQEALTTRSQRSAGGRKARNASTKAQRSAAAKRAALARWGKRGSDGR